MRSPRKFWGIIAFLALVACASFAVPAVHGWHDRDVAKAYQDGVNSVVPQAAMPEVTRVATLSDFTCDDGAQLYVMTINEGPGGQVAPDGSFLPDGANISASRDTANHIVIRAAGAQAVTIDSATVVLADSDGNELVYTWRMPEGVSTVSLGSYSIPDDYDVAVCAYPVQ